MKKEMFYGASPLIFERAKVLRNKTTPTEDILWQCLKNKQLGVKFRRQHPIALYIVDFYCHKLKLVIEVDGNIHNLEENKKNDKEREKNLKELGLSVIRFTNKEVQFQTDKVLEVIKSFINFKKA